MERGVLNTLLNNDIDMTVAIYGSRGRCVAAFGIADALVATDLIAMQERLDDFIESRYPEAVIHREWPVSWKNSHNQLLQGWIDMLLETPDGYVIIDHKSYPGTERVERVKEYAPQLAVYRQAVESASGRKVVALLVHFPLLGQIYRLDTKENGDGARI